MPSWLKIATFFLIGSLLTIWLKKPTLFISNTNINDLLLLLSMGAFSLSLLKKELTIPRFVVPIAIATCIVLSTLIIGSTISYFGYHVIAPDALREYVRMLSAVAIFFEIVIIGYYYKPVIKTFLLALALPSIIIPFLIYLPASVLPFVLDDSRSRFTGFLYDPNYFAIIQLLPTFILLWIYFAKPLGEKLWISLISLILFSFSVSSIIWSGSRGGIAGLIIGLVFLVGISFLKLHYKKALLFSATVIIATCISFFILPTGAKNNVLHRIDVITVENTSTNPENSVPNKTNLQVPIISKFTARQGRFPIWMSALEKIKNNPFGYGPGYGNIVDIMGGDNDHYRVAHNTFLQILLTGGFVLFITLSAGIILLGKKIITSQAPFYEAYFLVAAMISSMTAGIFLDSLWSRSIWIIAGLIIVSIHYEKKS